MIEFLKEGLSSAVSIAAVLLILAFVAAGIAFGVTSGYWWLGVIGAIIGLPLGIVCAILIFGSIATMIDTNETANGILIKLCELESKFDDFSQKENS